MPEAVPVFDDPYAITIVDDISARPAETHEREEYEADR
jgi:hypothetical protein